MKFWSVLCAFVAASVLTASCGQQVSPSEQSYGVTPYQRQAIAKTSWMRPGASSKKALLYVSNASDNAVYVYDYKNETQVGQLNGFYNPGPQCVDRKGDVYIVNTGTATTLEYKHGGASLIHSYANGSDDAVGCTVDAAGDLAITSLSPAQIVIYAGGKGNGETYSGGPCTYMWPAGYDNSGNLFAEGHSNSGVIICELPKGSSEVRQVSFSKFINFPGSIQWDGKYLTVADQEYQGYYITGLYQTTESPSGDLTVVSSTELTANCYDDYTEVLEPFIVGNANSPVMHKQGTTVVGGNGQCSDVGVSYWSYPTGGLPKKSFGSYNVAGISVSFK